MVLIGALIAYIIKILNILIHSTGIYLLRNLPKHERRKTQVFLILNLSIIELIINVISLLRNIVKQTPIYGSKFYNDLKQYTYIFDYSVLNFTLHLMMIFITIDRLLLIVLNVNYSIILNRKKTKIVVAAIWLSGWLVFTAYVLLFIYKFDDESQKSCITAKYVTLTFDFIFVVISIVAYAIIFRALVFQQRKKVLMRRRASSFKGHEKLWKTFQKSRFYVVMLLVLTFILFVIPPDATFAFYACSHGNKAVHYTATILYALSYTSDGVIYIFANRQVRKILVHKLQRFCACVEYKQEQMSQRRRSRLSSVWDSIPITSFAYNITLRLSNNSESFSETAFWISTHERIFKL